MQDHLQPILLINTLLPIRVDRAYKTSSRSDHLRPIPLTNALLAMALIQHINRVDRITYTLFHHQYFISHLTW